MNALFPHANSPCFICHNKNGDTMMKSKLENMLERCEHLNITPSKEHIRFNWGIHSHCRYGIHCDSLHRFDIECNRIAERLTPYLITIAKESAHDMQMKAEYHEMYEKCRGDFPAVCHALERLSHS